MVKIVVRYPTLPEFEIECEVEECAQLLTLLGGKSKQAIPNPLSLLNKAKEPAVERREGERIIRNRSYRGKVNRRDMVLNAFRELRQDGRIMPHLEDIKAKYASLYPDEDLTNLDQVVRDLANKTEKIERCERGSFRLSDIAI